MGQVQMTPYQQAIAKARAEWEPSKTAGYAVIHKWAEFLNGTAGNVTSQSGEDGLLAALFERIGTKNRWCFEVGAGDGIELSNTKALRDDGWYSVLIEASEKKFASLVENEHKRKAGSMCIHCRIEPTGPHSIAAILDDWHGMTPDIDLGVIDIDGKDLFVWQRLEKYRPRVMLVEYNIFGDAPNLTGQWQAGSRTVAKLGREKGYVPIVQTAYNLLFIDEGEMCDANAK